MPLTLYRLTKQPDASLDDFRSNMERCLAPRPAEVRDPGEWAGLSMFDTREQAEYTARRYADRGMGQFVAEDTFMTENLWGVGSTAPYMHDGRASTLTEAIHWHGGEAEPSRNASTSARSSGSFREIRVPWTSAPCAGKVGGEGRACSTS